MLSHENQLTDSAATKSEIGYRREEGPDDIYVVVAEWDNQAPVVMETEGCHTSFDAAFDRMKLMHSARRYCVARLVYASGNALVLHDLKRMQK